MKAKNGLTIESVLKEKGLSEQDIISCSSIVKSEVKSRVSDILFNIYAVSILLLFLAINALVMWVIFTSLDYDNSFLVSSKNTSVKFDRIIDSNVIIALITGVSAQTAAVFLTITKFFLKKTDDSDE